MQVSDFDYHLPENLIAQQPLPERDAARMLHLAYISGGRPAIVDRQFREFPGLLRPGDLLVFNNTRVLPARLFASRRGIHAEKLSGRNPASSDFLQGQVEVMLTRRTGQNEWQALVRPGRKVGVGEVLTFRGNAQLQAEVMARGDFGERTLRFSRGGGGSADSLRTPMTDADFYAAVEQLGHIPLPPYIHREDQAVDRERYQTVFASQSGAVAAPTAGLHFSARILEEIRARDIETAEVTLHVGLGTFQPVRVERVEDHKIHGESYSISAEAARQINTAMAGGRRVVAVGTTTVRTLEAAAAAALPLQAGDAEAGIFIYPGYQFKVVGAMLTNFHLPQSTLLMLVSAFGGRDAVLAAYRHAVAHEYRFYSYGDCMFIE